MIGRTTRLPLAGSVCAGSSAPIRTMDEAFSVVHARVTGLPAAVEVTGSWVAAIHGEEDG